MVVGCQTSKVPPYRASFRVSIGERCGYHQRRGLAAGRRWGTKVGVRDLAVKAVGYGGQGEQAQDKDQPICRGAKVRLLPHFPRRRVASRSESSADRNLP